MNFRKYKLNHHESLTCLSHKPYLLCLQNASEKEKTKKKMGSLKGTKYLRHYILVQRKSLKAVNVSQRYLDLDTADIQVFNYLINMLIKIYER